MTDPEGGHRAQDFRPRLTRRLERALSGVRSARACLTVLGADALARGLQSPTRREELLARAMHEADLLGHPYVDRDHVLLAAARLAGDRTGWEQVRAGLTEGLPSRGRWRPRGPRSLARPPGQRALSKRRIAALQRDEQEGWSAVPGQPMGP